MWKPNLYVGYLKQYMVNWINIGMDAMTSDDFKDSIRKSFMRDARHANMTSAARVVEAHKKIELETILEIQPPETPTVATNVNVTDDASYCDAVNNYQDDDDDSVGLLGYAIDCDQEDMEDGLVIED